MTNKLLEKGVEVIGYFYHRDETDLNGVTVLVAVDEGHSDRLTYYSPIGQHSEGDREYLEECVSIGVETYVNSSSGCYTPLAYLNPVNLIGTPEHFTLEILRRYESLELLCEALDSCYDLYDLDVIDSEVEQKCYEYLAKTSAVNLWAVYCYANDMNENYEYTFDTLIEDIKKSL